MLFKKEKLELIRHWCDLNDGYPLWGADDNGNVFNWELIEQEFDYWTQECPFTHNQITRWRDES
tara:strand:- start:360 stop:551 length:192 start_codon:yes stop_codon:yes gene_type:complete